MEQITLDILRSRASSPRSTSRPPASPRPCGDRRGRHASRAGALFRDAKGRFKDIQTYKGAHGQSIKRRHKAEGT